MINEFLAPFQGIKNVREAHGNRAAAELAVQICAEFPNSKSAHAPAPPPETILQSAMASQYLQTQGATLDKSKNEIVDAIISRKGKRRNCRTSLISRCAQKDNPAPVQPPLGWVLSSATQTAFQKLLTQCENGTELEQLEIAIGKKDNSQQARSP